MDDQELLERFAAVEVPATRLTPETLVGAGRRSVRRRRRRAVRVGCGAALAVGVLVAVPAVVSGTRGAPPAAGEQTVSCPVSRLPVPAAMRDVSPAAVDPTGRFIVGNNVVGDEPTDPRTGKVDGVAYTRPVLWVDRQPTELAASVKAVRATGVNSSGTVVAIAGEKHFDSVLRYRGGVPQELTMPPGDWDFSPQPAINAGGDVIATVQRRGGKMKDNVTLLWKAGSTTAVELPLPAGTRAWGLTDDGRIVGEVWSADSLHITAHVFDERGKDTRLATPGGQDAAVISVGGDWVSGNLWPSGTVVRWNIRTGEMTDLDLHTPGMAINGRGWVIADGKVQRDDAVVELAPASEGSAGDPLDLADNGTVVGAMLGYRDGSAGLVSSGPVVWQCGP